MTREEYVDIRKSNSYSIDMLYEYYQYLYPNNEGLIKSKEQFIDIHNEFIRFMPINADKAYQYFDALFNIVFVIKNNKIIDIK